MSGNGIFRQDPPQPSHTLRTHKLAATDTVKGELRVAKLSVNYFKRRHFWTLVAVHPSPPVPKRYHSDGQSQNWCSTACPPMLSRSSIAYSTSHDSIVYTWKQTLSNCFERTDIASPDMDICLTEARQPIHGSSRALVTSCYCS